ncbi:DNA-binding response OmpR family regulator [Paraburkholderia atlantica]
MSGTLLLTQLRIAGARTPFIFVSGNLTDHDHLISTRYAGPLLEKPIEPDELVALVRAMLRSASLQKHSTSPMSLLICGGPMNPHTDSGENGRHEEVSDEQPTWLEVEARIESLEARIGHINNAYCAPGYRKASNVRSNR